MITGGPNSPQKAAPAPAAPRPRAPNTPDRLTMFGPGRNRQSANVSLNSSAVIHRCWSTRLRRAHTNTPPKPARDSVAKATNSAIRLGVAGVGSSGASIATGFESGDMNRDLERRLLQGQRY